MAADLVAMIAVGVTAAVLRARFGWFDSGLNHTSIYLTGPFVLVGWVLMIALLGGYRERLFGAGTEEYRTLQTATMLAAGLTGVGIYLTKTDLSRGFFMMAFGMGSIVLVLERAALRRGLHRARQAGGMCHDVVIAGTPTHVDEIARVLSRESWLGYRVTGAVLPAGLVGDETVSGTPVLGTIDNILTILDSTNADVIFVAGGALDGADQMRELVWDLDARDIQVVVAPSVTDVSRERVKVRPVAGLPLVHIDPTRHVQASRRTKRLFDLVLSCGLIAALAPLMVTLALLVKLSDRGPVLFRQVRIGRQGNEFSCLKFRTMVVDAEERLAALQAAEGFKGGLFKVADDPRITSTGRWLRRFSLDELPQLWNVVRGDMSLVGPRPPLPTEVATYDRFTRRRLHVRPGMTGLWQVSGRSDLSWADAVRLDLYYVDNWSMMQDMSILARTFGAVFGSRGAY